MDIGKSCSEVTCKQTDFLPFDCKFCGRVFCLDHRDVASHRCSKADFGDKKVIICPICQKTISFEVGKESEEQVWAKHQAKECGKANGFQHKGSPSKIVCASKGCHTKLTEVNKYECKKCHQQVCLKHRFEEDHDCPKIDTNTNKNIRQKEKTIPQETKIANVKEENKKVKKKKGFFGELVSKLACGSKKKNYDRGEIV